MIICCAYYKDDDNDKKHHDKKDSDEPFEEQQANNNGTSPMTTQQQENESDMDVYDKGNRNPPMSHTPDFLCRFFGPKAGINEDPVTGYSRCMLGPYFPKNLAN